MKTHVSTGLLPVLLAAATASLTAQSPRSEGGLTVLDSFIAEETAVEGSDTLMQTARPIDSVFTEGLGLLDTPRSVTVLTPEAMRQLAVRGFDDLDRAGAGLTRPNIFGIPGLPFIRGDNAGVYFNGMRRIPNQNETPTSFGSLESMDIVKGPAPAQFGPTNAGGYVNFIPKSPYFDRFRGSIETTFGRWDHFNTQVDVGGPVLLGDTPLAYRVSITSQQADSYYNNVGNDYISVYAALKARLSEKLTVFAGTEYYSFKSNENAGWNRVTQDLIDNGNYIYGEMDPNTTSPAFGGFTNNDLVDDFFPTQNAVPLGVDDPNLALVVPAADFQARFGVPTGAGSAYLTGPAAAAIPIFFQGSLFGYKYTPGYFSGGGRLFTKKIEGNQVLSDPSDFADSTTAIFFTDLVWSLDNDRRFSAKTFAEYILTEKLSSYGFAHNSDSVAFEQKLAFDEKRTIGGVRTTLQYGADYRFTYNSDANDFFVEPFNRRDVSNPVITAQSIVLAGPQLGWALIGGSESRLHQLGFFGQARFEFTDTFSVFAGLRAERAWFQTRGTPKESAVKEPFTSGNKSYWSGSINPILKVTDNVSLYAAIQQGTSLNPAQTGGVNGGERNFVEAPFYEGGVKVGLLDGRLYGAASVYTYEKETLANLPTGAIDSDRYEASGYEFELSFAATDQLTIVANFGEQVSKFEGGFPFTTVPMTPEQVALYAGAIQYDVVRPTNVRYARNPEAERAGYPQFAANLFAVLNFKNGFGVGFGPSYKEAFWLDNERTLRLPDALVWNANLFYKAERWEVFARFNNLTSEDYFLGSTFAPTMIVTKAEPFEAQVSFKIKF